MDRFIKLMMLPTVLISSLIDQSGFVSFFPKCIFKYFFDFECWGCGMTRAFLELMKFNFLNAVQLNPFSPSVFILMALVFFNELIEKRN